MNQTNWPESLKDFINKSMAGLALLPPVEKAKGDSELKQLVYNAYTTGAIHSTNWQTMKLKALSGSNGGKRKAPSSLASPVLVEEPGRREKRLRRFDTVHNGTPPPVASAPPVAFLNTNPSTDVIDWDQHTIVGSSSVLEKPFLRLTSVPDPTTIRPLPVLEKTLELLKRKWRDESNYRYICDQFKSMRQDLTVQRIKNNFTVSVYEIHARIALEKADLGEFNQCQGQLKQLYALGLQGHRLEFLAYRVLYLLYSQNKAELNATLAEITDADREDPGVSHALQVRVAMAQGNYTRLFRLFLDTPKMGGYLMDHFISRERLLALIKISKAYKQLPLSYVAIELAFDSDEETVKFLQSLNAYYVKDGASLDLRLAHPYLNAGLSKYRKVDLKGQI